MARGDKISVVEEIEDSVFVQYYIPKTLDDMRNAEDDVHRIVTGDDTRDMYYRTVTGLKKALSLSNSAQAQDEQKQSIDNSVKVVLLETSRSLILLACQMKNKNLGVMKVTSMPVILRIIHHLKMISRHQQTETHPGKRTRRKLTKNREMPERIKFPKLSRRRRSWLKPKSTVEQHNCLTPVSNIERNSMFFLALHKFSLALEPMNSDRPFCL